MKFKWSYVILIFLVIADLILLFQINYPAVEINPYLLRDMHRAIHSLQGHFVLVGPDFTAGSYAPGPFFYLTIMPVLAFAASPFAVVAYMLLVKVAAQLAFSITFSRVMKVPASVIYIFLSCSAFLLERFIWVNNSSFIAPFVQILAVSGYFYWKTESSRKSDVLLFLSALFLGGGLQTHFSMFFVIPLLLLLIAEKAKVFTQAKKDYALFLGGITISLIPFLIVYINDRFFHWFSGAIFFRSQLGAREFANDWWRIFGKNWQVFSDINVFKIEVIALFSYILLRAVWILWKTRNGRKSYFDKAFLAIAVMTVGFAGWILSGSYMRYFTVLFICGLVYLTYDFYHLLAAKLRRKSVVLAIAMILGLLVRNEFFFFPKNLGLQGKCEDCIRQMQVLCDYFNDQKVSFEQFSKATFELFPTNSHGSQYYLNYCMEQKTGFNPDNHKRYLFADSDFVSDQQALSEAIAQLPVEVKPFYSDLSRFKKEVEMKGFTLFSVDQGQPLDLYNRYSNLAYSYQLDPAMGEDFVETVLQQEGYELYKASFCSSPVFCDLYVSVKLEDQGINLHLNSRVFQTKTDLMPLNGTAKNLRLDYLCDGKVTRLNVASSIGISSEKNQNRTLFTPLELRSIIDCKSVSLQSISMDILELSSNTGLLSLKNQSFPLKAL